MKKLLVFGELLASASGLLWLARRSTSHRDPGTALRSGDADRTTAYDTLQVAGGVLHLKPTTQAAFRRLAPASSDITNYDGALSADIGAVRRQAEALIFQPTRGPAITLRNESEKVALPGGQSSYLLATRTYYYCGVLPATHQWLVEMDELKGGARYLLDQRTGQRTTLLGQPVVSPDGRHLLSVYTDPDNDGSLKEPTGLQLYQLGLGAPRLLWTRDPQHWGATEARWAGPRTMLLEQDHTPPNQGGGGPPPTYVEVTLP